MSKYIHKLFSSKGYVAMHLINYTIFLILLLHNLSCLENMIAEIEMESYMDTWIQKAQDIDANSALGVFLSIEIYSRVLLVNYHYSYCWIW